MALDELTTRFNKMNMSEDSLTGYDFEKLFPTFGTPTTTVESNTRSTTF
eukprot:CAMPEP_0168722112 /NCGR_PEP_ID=MMETSP0724-20121128/2430_1 /TAXON_ID=265536 /ORGANISM="Amphiprora sp., Strain CCMP467" /LENGTH=48 /DNA_ID= /DNA_START= /DNA_END= /DNA_ORIENTATION=